MTNYAKSTDEKKMIGTYRPDRDTRANRAILTIEGQLPEQPPTGLTKEARAAWRMVLQCAPEGVLCALDHSLLERWARNYAMYRKLQKAVDAEGETIQNADGLPMVNPSFNALIKCQQVLAVCERELGFTPVARSKVVKVEKETKTINPFDEI